MCAMLIAVFRVVIVLGKPYILRYQISLHNFTSNFAYIIIDLTDDIVVL